MCQVNIELNMGSWPLEATQLIARMGSDLQYRQVARVAAIGATSPSAPVSVKDRSPPKTDRRDKIARAGSHYAFGAKLIYLRFTHPEPAEDLGVVLAELGGDGAH